MLNKLIIALILFLSLSETRCFGQEYINMSYPAISRREINEALFLRYIKPQLKFLVKDYYSLVRNLGPFYHELSKVHDNIQELTSYYTELFNLIKFKRDKSKITLLQEKVFFYATNLEEEIFEVIDIDDFLVKRKKENLIQDYFFIHPYLLQISQKLALLNHLLLDAWIVGFDEALYKKSRWDQIDMILWEINLVFDDIIYISLGEYQNDFLVVWNDFLKIIEREIIPHDNMKLLSIHLGNMNFAWNNFHKDMTKGGKLKENRDLLILGVIQNRWNSILKLILN